VLSIFKNDKKVYYQINILSNVTSSYFKVGFQRIRLIFPIERWWSMVQRTCILNKTLKLFERFVDIFQLLHQDDKIWLLMWLGKLTVIASTLRYFM